jgi:large-conductance mechanosensitive channel
MIFSLIKEFKEFAIKGNMIDISTAILALEACVWFLAQNIQFILALIS